MSICLCYHDEQNFLHERGVCYGTKEKEPCSCGGNPVKCDFYEEVREKYIHRTNADRIRGMTDEELAKLFVSGWFDGPLFTCPVKDVECESDISCDVCFMEWLKAPVGGR